MFIWGRKGAKLDADIEKDDQQKEKVDQQKVLLLS